MKYRHKHILSILLLILLAFSGCVSVGLVSEEYPEEYYTVEKLLPENTADINPTFIIYGDTQASWSILHDFYREKNWNTWKVFIFPFYEIYKIGQGVVGGFNWLRHYPDSDIEIQRMMRDAVYEEAKRSEADFILNAGDITSADGRRPWHWKRFLEINKHEHPLLNEIPYLPTVGNHDRVNDEKYGAKNYKDIFGYPQFYKIEFKDLDLFVVDSDIIIDWKNEIEDKNQEEQFSKWFISGDPQNPGWLENALAESDKKFKIISIHHSPLTYGVHWKDWLKPSNGAAIEEKRIELIELFKEHNVQLVFSGHDHIYQHNVLDYGLDKEMHFVVSSSGGVPVRDETDRKKIERIGEYYSEQGFDVRVLKNTGVYHYCMVRTTADQLTLTAFQVPLEKNEGYEVMEEFTISSD